MKQLEGTLSQWDNASGTGIITPVHGDQRYPVTLADFTLGKSAKPQLGEELLFEAGVDANGRPCARSVTRPVHALPPPPDEMPDYIPPRMSQPGSTGTLPLVLMLAAAGFGYYAFTTPPELAPAELQQPLRTAQEAGKKLSEKLRAFIRQL